MKVAVDEIVKTLRFESSLHGASLADAIESHGIDGMYKLDAEQWDAFQESLSSRGDIDALIAEAVTNEREACAQICDHYDGYSGSPMNFAYNCSEAIRARGQK